ncbi:unnamed protein product [Lathyrus oleraceus]
MQNFKVQHNDFTLKSCDHRLKLLFIGEEGESKLTPKDFPDIPQYKFNFKSFAEINSRKYYPDLLLDFTGVGSEAGSLISNLNTKKFTYHLYLS